MANAKWQMDDESIKLNIWKEEKMKMNSMMLDAVLMPLFIEYYQSVTNWMNNDVGHHSSLIISILAVACFQFFLNIFYYHVYCEKFGCWMPLKR